MGNALESEDGSHRHTPESLRTLAAYLETSLEKGKSVIMMRRDPDAFSIYIGNPADEDSELRRLGTISTAMAGELLELTQVGLNRITIADQTYRFFRSFTLVADVGAVIFAPT